MEYHRKITEIMTETVWQENIHSHMVSKPFIKIFTDASNYDAQPHYLKEAKAMMRGSKTVEDDFMQYLAERVSPAQLSELYRCYSEIETF